MSSEESPAYKPIPSVEARILAEKYDKSIVILWAWDPVYGLLHTTTYGVSQQEKDWAAKGGEIATAALGGQVPARIEYEDYRIAHLAELTRACEQLLDAPHQEHFIVRLNEEEMAGLEAIKQAVAKAKGILPETGPASADQTSPEATA